MRLLPRGYRLRWSCPLPDVVPVLVGYIKGGALRRDALEVAGDLGQLVVGVRLPLNRKLRRHVVLPLVHVAQVVAGERLADQPVVGRVAVAARVRDGTALEQLLAGRQEVGSERPAPAPPPHVPAASGLGDHAVAPGGRGYLVVRPRLDIQLYTVAGL